MVRLQNVLTCFKVRFPKIDLKTKNVLITKMGVHCWSHIVQWFYYDYNNVMVRKCIIFLYPHWWWTTLIFYKHYRVWCLRISAETRVKMLIMLNNFGGRVGDAYFKIYFKFFLRFFNRTLDFTRFYFTDTYLENTYT